MNLAKEKPKIRKMAKIQMVNGDLGAFCPNCGKKATDLYPYTKCTNFPWKCKNTKCTEKEFEINYNKGKCLI